MRVLTLNDSDFRQECESLSSLLNRRGPYDIVIGIASGGVEVARIVSPLLEGNPTSVTVKLQRKSTRNYKGRWFRKFLQVLPKKVKDHLRMLESRFLSLTTSSPRLLPEISVPVEILAGKRIAIVDDAIDSGVTMAAVVKAVKQKNPAAQIVTGVITVTTPNPIYKPDYSLFTDRTLIRFPWSADA